MIIDNDNVDDNPLAFIDNISQYIFDQLGFGFNEKVYQKAFVKELSYRYPIVESEYYIPQYFYTSGGDRIQLTTLKIDIWIPGRKILIELKSLSRSLTRESKEWLQVLRYHNLVNSNYKYLINFRNTGVEILCD